MAAYDNYPQTHSADPVVTKGKRTTEVDRHTTDPVNFPKLADAAAKATVAETAVSAVAVSEGGGGYRQNVQVVFTGGGGSGAKATATVAAGKITAVAVTAGGTGYTSAPTVSFQR